MPRRWSRHEDQRLRGLYAAGAPLNDDDWQRYHALAGDIELVHFTESPHDIFRPDRTRYPKLVAALVERADSAVSP